MLKNFSFLIMITDLTTATKVSSNGGFYPIEASGVFR